ncbi:hypothetical protein M089_4996 [Bacteroides ovatus str. 3725 D9 iii]|nr:hypothetical protein HMPREF9010_04885 [Bacteroides sp. 3_1_23]KDS22962.1 hypothetical protein M089_4996 [Bacteroides ovatus str. 3725 D9 iii]
MTLKLSPAQKQISNGKYRSFFIFSFVFYLKPDTSSNLPQRWGHFFILHIAKMQHRYFL